MKRCIVSILLIGIIAMVHAKPSMPETLDQYREACAQEVGISLESVTRPSHSSGPPPEPSKDMKCFMRCLLMRAGILDGNGALQTSKLHLPEDAAGVDLDKCSSITDSDPCEQTYLMEIDSFAGIDQYLELCSRNLNIAWEGEAPISKQDSSQSYLREPDRDGKCLLNCMLLMAGVIDNNGTIQGFFISLPDPTSCSNFNETDVCERGYLIEKCIRRELRLIPRI